MFKVNHAILDGKPSPNSPPHVQLNRVRYTIINRDKVPPKQEGKKQIYRIIYVGHTIGVGETTHVPTRIAGGYAWCIKTMKPDGSTIIKAMQQEACRVNALGEEFYFEVEFLEHVDARDARRTEAEYVAFYRSKGEPILNKTAMTSDVVALEECLAAFI